MSVKFLVSSFTPSPSRQRRAAAVLAIALAIGPASAGAASLIVDWSGNYVEQTQPLDRNTSVSGSLGGIEFSYTQPMSPIPNPPPNPPNTIEYGDPTLAQAGTNAVFYGGAITSFQDKDGLPQVTGHVLDYANVENQGPNDSIHIDLAHGSDWHDLHAVLLWKQENFLTGNAPFTFGPDSVVTIALASSPGEVLGNTVDIRLVVRNEGGQYFVSETAFAPGPSDTNFVWNSTNQFDPVGLSNGWQSYSPSGYALDFDQGLATYPSTLSSITAIGFLYDLDEFHNNAKMHIESFSVTGTPIPEPSTIGAGITAALLGLLVRFRRRMAVRS